MQTKIAVLRSKLQRLEQLKNLPVHGTLTIR